MSDYRFYMMTGDGHIAGVHEFRSPSEEIAILTADRLRQHAAAELWNLRRRIKIFRPDGDADRTGYPSIAPTLL